MSSDTELSHMDKENFGHPDFKRLHSEENQAAVKKPKTTSIKKSISWGSRADAMQTLSFQREYNYVSLVVVIR